MKSSFIWLQTSLGQKPANDPGISNEHVLLRRRATSKGSKFYWEDSQIWPTHCQSEKLEQIRQNVMKESLKQEDYYEFPKLFVN